MCGTQLGFCKLRPFLYTRRPVCDWKPTETARCVTSAFHKESKCKLVAVRWQAPNCRCNGTTLTPLPPRRSYARLFASRKNTIESVPNTIPRRSAWNLTLSRTPIDARLWGWQMRPIERNRKWQYNRKAAVGRQCLAVCLNQRDNRTQWRISREVSLAAEIF